MTEKKKKKKRNCRRERARLGQAPRAPCIATPYDSGVSRRSRALSIFPARSLARSRNDFRNMINCPAVAFRRRGGFQTDYGWISFCRCEPSRLAPRLEETGYRFQLLCISRPVASREEENFEKRGTFREPSKATSTIAIAIEN